MADRYDWALLDMDPRGHVTLPAEANARASRRPARPLRRRARLALVAWLGVTWLGCSARRLDTHPAPSVATPDVPRSTAQLSLPRTFALDVVDTVVFSFGTRLDAAGSKPIGGLSALTPGLRRGEYFVVSDETTSPRLLRFRIAVSRGRLVVEPLGFETLTAPVGDRSDGAATDFEGIACAMDGTCYLSSEGNQEREPRLAPSLVARRDGVFAGRLQLPEKFRPVVEGPATHGVRRNEAFESLALTPDGRRLVAASESSLVQDGQPPTRDAGALARMLVFERAGRAFVAAAEYAYPLGRVPMPEGFEEPTGSLGLVEILPLEDGSMLTMERAFVREAAGARRATNDIVLYRTSFEGATDVRDHFALASVPELEPMTKTTVFSLSSVAHRLPPALARLDNFEGMSAGPRLETGEPTILLLSDDNFSQSQVTAFVLLRVIAETAR